MAFHDIIHFRAHTPSLLIEIKVQLRWRWILKEQLVKFSSASRKLDSCWLFEKGQGTSIALRNGVSVLMNSVTLNNGAGSVIFSQIIFKVNEPLCVWMWRKYRRLEKNWHLFRSKHCTSFLCKHPAFSEEEETPNISFIIHQQQIELLRSETSLHFVWIEVYSQEEKKKCSKLK